MISHDTSKPHITLHSISVVRHRFYKVEGVPFAQLLPTVKDDGRAPEAIQAPKSMLVALLVLKGKAVQAFSSREY